MEDHLILLMVLHTDNPLILVIRANSVLTFAELRVRFELYHLLLIEVGGTGVIIH